MQFEPIRCELCGDVLLIGTMGLVCGRGHGPIVYYGYKEMLKHCPELRIEHELSTRQRADRLKGILGE